MLTDAELFAPDRVPLSDYDRAAILFMAENKRPMRDIAGAVGRCDGTVKSEITRLRRLGVLPERYRNV